MLAEDVAMVMGLIDKLKVAATSPERERATADLKTAVMMAAEPEMEWADRNPVILTQGGRTYRAVELREVTSVLAY